MFSPRLGTKQYKLNLRANTTKEWTPQSRVIPKTLTFVQLLKTSVDVYEIRICKSRHREGEAGRRIQGGASVKSVTTRNEPSQSKIINHEYPCSTSLPSPIHIHVFLAALRYVTLTNAINGLTPCWRGNFSSNTALRASRKGLCRRLLYTKRNSYGSAVIKH